MRDSRCPSLKTDGAIKTNLSEYCAGRLPAESLIHYLDEWLEIAFNKGAALAGSAPPVVPGERLRMQRVIEFALRRFIRQAHGNAEAAAQDLKGELFKPGAVEAFLNDAKDAEAAFDHVAELFKLVDGIRHLGGLYYNTNCNPEGFQLALDALAKQARTIIAAEGAKS